MNHFRAKIIFSQHRPSSEAFTSAVENFTDFLFSKVLLFLLRLPKMTKK